MELQTNGIWALPVDSGRVSGGPELIRPNIGEIRSVGTSQNGNLYYSVSYSASDLLMGEFDFNLGELVGSSTRVNPHSMGGESASWSRNGRFLVYYPTRSSRTTFVRGKRPVSVLDTKNGTTLSMEPQIVTMSMPRISSDGKSLLINGRDSNDREGLYVIDIGSGEVELLISVNEESERIGNQYHWSQDDKAVFVKISDRQESRAQRIIRILKYDIVSGTSTTILQSPGFWNYWISPDDQWIVYSYQNPVELEVFYNLPLKEQLQPPPSKIMLLHISSGEFRQLCQMTNEPSYNAGWNADGSEIGLFHRIIDRIPTEDGYETEARGKEFWRIPLDGSDPIVLPLRSDSYNLTFNPDGRRVVYVKSLTPRSRELWVMEYFLPPVEKN